MLRALKNRLHAMAPPAVFLALTWYFGWNAIHGRSGLEAQAAQARALAQANAQFAVVDAQRQNWETRIADLGQSQVAPDMLDGEARAVLNLAQPNDLVVELPSK